MLRVTRQARNELHQMLMQILAAATPQTDAAELGFRIVADSPEDAAEAQLGLALDAPREGDEIVDHQGRSVLIVDPPTSLLLCDLTLDVHETPEGTQLELRR